MCPELGRSALDAVELMDVGVNYMREHMIDEARIQYAITDTGGDAPNVVQSRAQVLYAIRAPKITQVKELYNRVCNIAKGAALMTETTVEIRQVAAYSNLISSKILADHTWKNLARFHIQSRNMPTHKNSSSPSRIRTKTNFLQLPGTTLVPKHRKQ